jgi:hypothetical protein
MRDPIGVATVEQDEKGLRFDGQLVLEDPTARKAHAHMKAGSVAKMSIGFDVMPGGAEVMKSGTRKLTALELWEISPVTFAMNPATSIDSVKAMPQFDTIRECEVWLRDELDFTHAQAKEFVARFKGALRGARDELDEIDVALKQHDWDFLRTVPL